MFGRSKNLNEQMWKSAEIHEAQPAVVRALCQVVLAALQEAEVRVEAAVDRQIRDRARAQVALAHHRISVACRLEALRQHGHAKVDSSRVGDLVVLVTVRTGLAEPVYVSSRPLPRPKP